MSAEPKQTSPQSPRFAAPPSPHITSGETVHGIMVDVMVALLPSLGVSTYFFGPRVLIMTAIALVSCVFFEFLYRLAMRKPQSIGDLSACVTGILLAMCLPVNAPYWTAIAGAFFAIVIVKQLYGGLGKNFMNPALAGRVFLFSFPALMSNWAVSGTDFWTGLGMHTDAATAATPLESLHQGLLPEYSLQEMLIGAHSGNLGEVSSIALILGGLYLICRKVISARIPLCFVGTVAALTYLFPLNGNDPLEWMLYHLLSGGLLLGAFFMATDYVTSPITPAGQVVFAIGCGVLTVFLHYFGAFPEGVGFAILIMNAFAPLLDKIGMPRRPGEPRFRSNRKGGTAP